VVAPETGGALLVGDGLPAFPRLLAELGLEREAAAEVEAWWDSWETAPGEGSRIRDQVYPLATRVLYPELGLAGTQDLVGRNALNIRAVASLTSMISSGAISDALSRAEQANGEARRLLAEGEGEPALSLALRASDALWSVSPRQVATDLLSRASEALGRKQGVGAYSEEELTRIRRLMHGASEALDAGDYPGAIRRAYYACQLLGADPT